MMYGSPLQGHLCTANGETKEDLPPTGTVKKALYSYISEKIRLQFQPSIDPNDIPYEQIIAWWNKDIYVFMYSTKRL